MPLSVVVLSLVRYVRESCLFVGLVEAVRQRTNERTNERAVAPESQNMQTTRARSRLAATKTTTPTSWAPARRATAFVLAVAMIFRKQVSTLTCSLEARLARETLPSRELRLICLARPAGGTRLAPRQRLAYPVVGAALPGSCVGLPRRRRRRGAFSALLRELPFASTRARARSPTAARNR